MAWDAWKKHFLSNPAFSILTRCAGGDPQRNLAAAVGWGTRGSQPGGDRSNVSSCARTVAQGLGMGRMEKVFPVEPCLFHPDPMRWWRSPRQRLRSVRHWSLQHVRRGTALFLAHPQPTRRRNHCTAHPRLAALRPCNLASYGRRRRTQDGSALGEALRSRTRRRL